MWCIPKLTDEFRERMEDVLALYAKPCDPKQPVVCFDEKTLQLLADFRPSIPLKPGSPKKEDYQYVRRGTANIFVTIEPKAGIRHCTVTDRRTKRDFALIIKDLLDHPYKNAEKVHIVLDNLNTHNASSFLQTFGTEETERLIKRIQFHYTPKHASWLNMAEIEIGTLSRQCLKGQRFPDRSQLSSSVVAWNRRRDDERARINWQFDTKDAATLFPELYMKKSV